ELIDIIAAKVSIAVGGLHLDYTVAHFKDRDIEGATTEVVDGNHFIGLFVEAVGEGGSGRLIDDAHHFETGNLPGVFGGLALVIVKVSRHGDYGPGNFLAKIGFRGFLELAEDHGRDFRWGEQLIGDFNTGIALIARNHFVGNPMALFGHLVV